VDDLTNDESLTEDVEAEEDCREGGKVRNSVTYLHALKKRSLNTHRSLRSRRGKRNDQPCLKRRDERESETEWLTDLGNEIRMELEV